MLEGNANRLQPVEPLAVRFDEAKIDAIFAALNQCRLPGAAVGIAIDGKPVYRKGFGLASMELPVVLSPSIRLRLGSTTKHFTCFAYMLLCEEGRAGIDDPIGKYVPDLHPVTSKVTLRQLMGNISGIRDVLNVRSRFSGIEGQQVHFRDMVSLYREIDDVNAPPATTWNYNNGGFLLVSAAIERITGQAFEDVLRERIFEPLGMHDTTLRRWDTDFLPNSATQHMSSPNGGYIRSFWGTDSAGAGALVSTVNDMLRWLAHMDRPTVGSASTWAVMKSPQTLANGTSTAYGLGLMIGRYRGIGTLGHAGGCSGGNAQMIKIPAAGLDIVVLVNRHDVSGVTLSYKIIDACFPDLEPIKESNNVSFIEGTFRSPKTGRVVQLRASSTVPWAERGQQIACIDGMDMSVEPDQHGVLKPTGVFRSIQRTFTVIGDRANPTALRMADFGSIDELAAVRPVKQPDASAIVGHYRSSTTGTEIVITQSGQGARLHSTGRFGSTAYDLECLAEGIWRARQLDVLASVGILSFDSDGNGFHYSDWNTRALPFLKGSTSSTVKP